MNVASIPSKVKADLRHLFRRFHMYSTILVAIGDFFTNSSN